MKLPCGLRRNLLLASFLTLPFLGQAGLFDALGGGDDDEEETTSASHASASGEQYLKVREASLRSKPSYLGGLVNGGDLRYGQALQVVSDEGDWVKVRTGSNLEGYLHKSSLSEDAIKLSAGASNVSATAGSDEMALASKGFNAQIEARMGNRNAYDWVDWAESLHFSDAQKVTFLREGGLRVE